VHHLRKMMNDWTYGILSWSSNACGSVPIRLDGHWRTKMIRLIEDGF